MNPNTIVKNYAALTPKERFLLIAAAAERGDEAERDRLVQAGKRVSYSLADHWPYGHAFDELATMAFLELLEEVARYNDAWACDRQTPGPDDEPGDGAEAEGIEDKEAADEPGGEADADSAEDEAERPPWLRTLDLALAAGYVLRTKADGWKLFCERLNIPPFLFWQMLPGFDRLRRALQLADTAAFIAEGFLRWLNSIRPPGAATLPEPPLTVEAVADGHAKFFRSRVEWWGG
jgi:hypothetical protein